MLGNFFKKKKKKRFSYFSLLLFFCITMKNPEKSEDICWAAGILAMESVMTPRVKERFPFTLSFVVIPKPGVSQVFSTYGRRIC